MVAVKLRVNGSTELLELEPRVSLLDALREHLGLTGTKKGCNQGACGACTVLVDGERINSCLALAVQYAGREITTIEGVGAQERHPLQDAFVAERRLPVRLLHVGPDLLGHRDARRAPRGRAERGDPAPGGRRRGAVRGRDQGADERQPLPLRRLRRHHRSAIAQVAR